ncbi:MAG: UDP-N-acetylglucosamine--N-acetylmuramyl-(pentapeptide) pyrophosphoryl-undecaprenol N-acetylglucosamine transferase, partial [Candidatus Margulisiibacteriota bacterium]|nr:UDP-N-acetylglucosamine--N-acetylmuramyl-(pentapeptide) pyrophosphoryl-undecaprenol N-acetylglucosamine transferase [Candidatus Margulisiibacteriota bacterium]
MIIVVSGATGGHLYPAVALLNTLKKDSMFIVSRKTPVADILEPYNIPFKVIPCALKKFWQLPIDVFLIIQTLLKYRPKVLFLMGGSMCVPVALVAKLLGIPMVSFEQNTIPGRATRVVQWLVSAIITTFESTKKRLYCKQKVHCLGNPIRLKSVEKVDDIDQLLTMNGNTILVIGGSQGARGINLFFETNKQAILSAGFNVIHLAGAQYFNGGLSTHLVEHYAGCTYVALPYCHNMDAVYNLATHVVCRSGATTISELLSRGLPSILVPFPYSKDNHQHQNAIEYAEMVSNASVIKESDLTLTGLMDALTLPSATSVTPVKNAEGVVFSICEFLQSYLK